MRVEQGGLPGAFERVQFWDPANDQASVDAFADLPRAERGERDLGDLGGGDPGVGGLISDRVRVVDLCSSIVRDRGEGAFHGRIHAGGDGGSRTGQVRNRISPNHRLANSLRRVETARSIAGTSPAADTRFVSSKDADSAVDLWEACT